MTHFAGKAVRVLALTGLMTVVLAVSAAAAELPTGVGTITGSSVRMRAGASTSTSILTVMDKDTTVAVLGQENSSWYQISYAGKTGYVSADYLAPDDDDVFTAYGRISGSKVNVRIEPNTDCGIVASLTKGTALTINGLADGWFSVTLRDGSAGYIRSDLVDLDSTAKYAATADTSTGASSSVNGQALVDMARQYLGARYVYGGSGPKTFDCSGFTMYLCKQFGISMPHSATSQWQSGKGTKIYSIADMEPGDLVYFCDPTRSKGKACSHCGVYIGDGEFIHASSSGKGVITSNLTSGYYNRYFVGGLRIV